MVVVIVLEVALCGNLPVKVKLWSTVIFTVELFMFDKSAEVDRSKSVIVIEPPPSIMREFTSAAGVDKVVVLLIVNVLSDTIVEPLLVTVYAPERVSAAFGKLPVNVTFAAVATVTVPLPVSVILDKTAPAVELSAVILIVPFAVVIVLPFTSVAGVVKVVLLLIVTVLLATIVELLLVRMYAPDKVNAVEGKLPVNVMEAKSVTVTVPVFVILDKSEDATSPLINTLPAPAIVFKLISAIGDANVHPNNTVNVLSDTIVEPLLVTVYAPERVNAAFGKLPVNVTSAAVATVTVPLPVAVILVKTAPVVELSAVILIVPFAAIIVLPFTSAAGDDNMQPDNMVNVWPDTITEPLLVTVYAPERVNVAFGKLPVNVTLAAVVIVTAPLPVSVILDKTAPAVELSAVILIVPFAVVIVLPFTSAAGVVKVVLLLIVNV